MVRIQIETKIYKSSKTKDSATLKNTSSTFEFMS